MGTAYSADSRVWFTLWRGILTEAYFPTIDRPQLRDLEFLFTDGRSFFHEEKRDLRSHTERVGEDALAFRVTSEDPTGAYSMRKTLLTDPHLPCILTHVRLDVKAAELARNLRLFVLAAPHLDVGGWGNSGSVQEVLDRPVLIAEKSGVALAVAADVPFVRSSVGYVGASDGWTDLSQHRDLAWSFDRAPDGNVALTGEIPVGPKTEFTLGLAFGDTPAAAVTTLFQSLGTPFDRHEHRFLAQWQRTAHPDPDVIRRSGDNGHLFRASRAILLAHEDKTYPGAFIASLSIPWGASKGDEDRGGYHLVWVRDLYHAATALLAAGVQEAPLRALIFLATRQEPDGGFAQNFWLDGRPYWKGVQLDEVAFSILLAGQLHRRGSLAQFDPTPMVLRAARFLIAHGPTTQQDRWEEVGGYSPSTLAIVIAALTVASGFAERAHDPVVARFVQEHADFLEGHVEAWTVTRQGTLAPGIPRHYVRVRPMAVDNATPDEGSDLGVVRLPNLAPAEVSEFPASTIVDGGFLDLVRYGVRRPDDPTIADSVRVIDEVLRLTTPFGPVWHRYNHDGYGEQPDGGPYTGYGVGRAWPLLTGERGEYELANGADAAPFLRTLERLATPTGLLPEQVWDAPDRPEAHLWLGRPTESATPLVWAHAEYVKLLRSVADGESFDRLPEVVRRYGGARAGVVWREVWKFNRQPRSIAADASLRVIAEEPFRLHLSLDAWRTSEDRGSIPTSLGLHYVDLDPMGARGRRCVFTFYWPNVDRWEGRNYDIVADASHEPTSH